ncbi:hypothetical protein [Mucilaginibacter sp.]
MDNHSAENEYIPNRSQHIRAAKSAIRLLAVFGVAFTILILRFALGSVSADASTGLPDSEATYKAAQQYIRENMRAESLNFSSDGYQYAQKSDSVYVIRTSAELRDGDVVKSIDYSVLIKYKGGAADNQNSWLLLDISRN